MKSSLSLDFLLCITSIIKDMFTVLLKSHCWLRIYLSVEKTVCKNDKLDEYEYTCFPKC